jgi:hypothetical protein
LPTDGVWFNYRRSGSRPYDIPYKRKNMHRSRFGDAAFVRIVACMTVAGAGAGCGRGSDSGVGPDGKVHQGVGVSGAMTVSTTSVTIVQGRTATVTLTLTLKWRSERRDLPMKAVAIAGEWSDMATMEKCYDLPD